MSTVHAATMDGPAVPRSGTGRDAAFSRHQTWLREFEKAREAVTGEPDRGTASEPARAEPASAAEPAALLAAQALAGGPSPWAFGACVAVPTPRQHGVYAGPPDEAAHRLTRGTRPAGVATGPACAPTSIHGDSDPGASPGHPAPARRGAAQGPEGGSALSGQPYAEQAAQVYRRGDRLALVLRDARLPDERCDDILKALIGKGLPAGIREISVTLNGHTRAIQLPDQGA